MSHILSLFSEHPSAAYICFISILLTIVYTSILLTMTLAFMSRFAMLTYFNASNTSRSRNPRHYNGNVIDEHAASFSSSSSSSAHNSPQIDRFPLDHPRQNRYVPSLSSIQAARRKALDLYFPEKLCFHSKFLQKTKKIWNRKSSTRKVLKEHNDQINNYKITQDALSEMGSDDRELLARAAVAATVTATAPSLTKQQQNQQSSEQFISSHSHQNISVPVTSTSTDEEGFIVSENAGNQTQLKTKNYKGNDDETNNDNDNENDMQTDTERNDSINLTPFRRTNTPDTHQRLPPSHISWSLTDTASPHHLKWQCIKRTKDDIACAICLDPILHGTRIRTLACKHAYHSKCIQSWVLKNPKCPLCNSILKQLV